MEVFEKQRNPIRTRLDLAGVRVEFYRADHASSPPFHERAIVSCQARDEDGDEVRIRQDVKLSEVLSEAELEAGNTYVSAIIRAALSAGGFVAKPAPELSELSETREP